MPERQKFCEHRHLSYNSFRTQLGKYKKSDAYKNSQAQQSVGRELKKRSAKDQTEKNSKVEVKGRHAQISLHVENSNPDLDRMPGGHYRFKKGNQASLIHGKFAKKAFISDEYRELSSLPLTDQIALVKQHFHFINNLGVKKANQLMEDYENGKPVTKQVVNDKGEVKSETLPLEQALTEVAMETIIPLTEMIKALGTVEKGLIESELKSHTATHLSRSEQDSELAGLVQVREDNKWSASDLVAQCVMKQIELPTWLLKELEIELRYAEDDIDDSEGLSDDDAESIRERSLIRRSNKNLRLGEIRKRNAKIYENAADLGAEKLTENDEIEDAVIVGDK